MLWLWGSPISRSPAEGLPSYKCMKYEKTWNKKLGSAHDQKFLNLEIKFLHFTASTTERLLIWFSLSMPTLYKHHSTLKQHLQEKEFYVAQTLNCYEHDSRIKVQLHACFNKLWISLLKVSSCLSNVDLEVFGIFVVNKVQMHKRITLVENAYHYLSRVFKV